MPTRPPDRAACLSVLGASHRGRRASASELRAAAIFWRRVGAAAGGEQDEEEEKEEEEIVTPLRKPIGLITFL